jgi:hypothetical protein
MNMNTSHHFPALWLLTSVGEKYKIVETVDDAAEMLLQRWPSNGGREYIGALKACRDALYDIVPAEVVRDALMRAADESVICYIHVVQGGEAISPRGNGRSASKQT